MDILIRLDDVNFQKVSQHQLANCDGDWRLYVECIDWQTAEVNLVLRNRALQQQLGLN
ncbi:hypothetical protein [Thalassotalea ganghwensis]